MADQNEYLETASQSILLYNTDEQIRKMCRDCVEYYQDVRSYERHFAKQDAIIAEKDNTIANLLAKIPELITENQ